MPRSRALSDCIDTGVLAPVAPCRMVPVARSLCCPVQFAIGSVLSIIFWTTGLVKPPKLDAKLVCVHRREGGAQTGSNRHTAAAAAACVCQQAPQPADACADLGGTHCSSDRIVCCALHHSGIPLLQEARPTAWIRSVALRVCVAATHMQLLVSPYVVVAAAAARSPPSTLWPSSMCWAMC